MSEASSDPSSLPARGGRIAQLAQRVSTLELLFDLVFVFTISQVSSIVAHHPTVEGIAQAALIMALIWWMYDAFAWLTNQAAPETAFLRLSLIGAMAAFLVLSLAIPEAFGDSGLLFGLAYLAVVLIYLVVVLVHTGFFVPRGRANSVRWMILTGSLNTLGALSLVAAGFVTGPLDWALFALPLFLFFLSTFIAHGDGFAIGASHFVERHGLLMIIAFGESIVAVGAGAAGHEIGFSLVAGAVASVGIVAALWWCYFSGDDERAEDVMASAPDRRRTTLAVTAFFVDHLVMILGLVVLAAGLHFALVDTFAVAEPPAAWLLAGGVALYLLGDAEYRRELALGPWHWRVAAAILCAATGFLGLVAPSAWQLLALLVIVASALLVERRSLRR